MTTEKTSIDDYASWDSTAFHLLYKNYYKALVCYAMQFIGSSDTCEDIVQDLFSVMWERQLSFPSIYALDVYLYNSTRNKCLNYLKHRGVEMNYMKSIKEDVPMINPDDDDLSNERIYKMLFSTIDQLPARSREVFLQYMDGKSNKEISTALGISLETVKTHKKRSMIFLKKHLGKNSLQLLFILTQASQCN